MKYAAYLENEDWFEAEFYLADTPEEAEKAALAALLAQTEDYRDRNEHPDDEAWVELCFEGNWRMASGAIRS